MQEERKRCGPGLPKPVVHRVCSPQPRREALPCPPAAWPDELPRHQRPGQAGEDLAERAARPRHKHALAFRTHHAAGQDVIDRRAAGQRTEKDDRLPRGRGSRPKREDVLMVRGYGEGGGCSCEPRQDQGGLPCRICCPPEAGRDDLGLWICLSREGPAGARGIPGRGRSSRGLHFVERELRLKVAVKGGCCFREPGRQEELPARYFFLPLAGFSAY